MVFFLYNVAVVIRMPFIKCALAGALLLVAYFYYGDHLEKKRIGYNAVSVHNNGNGNGVQTKAT